MLKTLCYVEDRDAFEYIATSESGRLAARVKNPVSGVPEIEDLERVLQAKLDAADPKPEGLAELIEQVHQYNESVATFERVRYVKSLTPQLIQALKTFQVQLESQDMAKKQQNQNTILNMKLKVVKAEKDGE